MHILDHLSVLLQHAPIDPKLGPLEDNGGPTLTHLPLSGSPVIDAGNDFRLSTDQRGVERTLAKHAKDFVGLLFGQLQALGAGERLEFFRALAQRYSPDPEAVRACESAGEGATVALAVGAKTDRRHGRQPVRGAPGSIDHAAGHRDDAHGKALYGAGAPGAAQGKKPRVGDEQ